MAKHLAELQRLQRKAYSTFEAIRDLANNDERAFSNAFRIFNQLWLYQQEHRQALVQAGLKRAEIGEISSKIGQLNYTFYTRCADTRFLIGAYVFYEAIRLRQYFEGEASSSSAAVKRLRFNARFIVVCLLLNKKEEACSLMLEFQAHINWTPDAQEWQSLVDEVSQFLAADVGMPLPRSPGLDIPFKLNLRCCAKDPGQGVVAHTPRISHAVIASYMHQQVKIAELPVDVFRMMQTLEWSTPALELHGRDGRDEDGGAADAVQSGGTMSPAGIAAAAAAATAAVTHAPPLPCANPRKTTLFCTSATQLLSTLHGQAAAAQGEHGNSVLLLVLGVSSLRSCIGAEGASGLQMQLQQQQRHSGEGSNGPSVHEGNASMLAMQQSQTSAAASVVARNYPSRSNSGSQHNPGASGVQWGASEQQCEVQDEGQWGDGLDWPSGGSGPPPSLSAGGMCTCSCSQMDLGKAFCLSPPTQALLAKGQPQQEGPQGTVAEKPASGAAVPPAAAAAEATGGAAASNVPLGKGDGALSFSLGSGPSSSSGQGAAARCMEHLLLPQDLLPLTRRRLMLVVDSDAAGQMASLQGKEQGYPVVALLSPSHRPSAFGDYRKTGSLFTMFLSAPVMALCLSMGLSGPSTQQLTALQETVDGALHKVAVALQQALSLGSGKDHAGGVGGLGSAPDCEAWSIPFEDAMLRQYMTRFVLARSVWAFHRASTGRPECQATCFPPLPAKVDAQSSLCRCLVLRISRVLDRQVLFSAAEGAADALDSADKRVEATEGVSDGFATLRVS